MKCTWDKCGKETGKPCPPEWIKHTQFDPRVLKIFFMGTEHEKALESLDAFVCSEHLPIWRKSFETSKKLSKKKQPDYEI